MNRPLHIAHISATFPPYRGGTGNVCRQNAAGLAQRGHIVTVFCPAVPGAPAVEQLDGFGVRRLRPLLRLGNAALLPGLLGTLRGFDIIHLHYPFFGGELSALAAALTHTPLLITYHQDVLLAGPRGAVERLLRGTLSRATLRAARRVLFTSLDYARNSYALPLLRGASATIGALPNGVDTTHFYPASAPTLRTRCGVAPGEQMLLLVAGLDHAHAFKGVSVLLTTLTQLDPSVKAVIVGDGDLRAGYVDLAMQFGMGQRVHFAGRVSDAELPGYYQAADLTVLPSTTMGEAFGLTLLESMACATPVIASRLPGVRTLVEPGATGLLAQPGNPAALAAAISQLLADPGLRHAMGLRGRAVAVQRYAWPRVIDQLETIYAELLVSAPQPTAAERSNQWTR